MSWLAPLLSWLLSLSHVARLTWFARTFANAAMGDLRDEHGQLRTDLPPDALHFLEQNLATARRCVDLALFIRARRLRGLPTTHWSRLMPAETHALSSAPDAATLLRRAQEILSMLDRFDAIARRRADQLCGTDTEARNAETHPTSDIVTNITTRLAAIASPARRLATSILRGLFAGCATRLIRAGPS
jgi:hypothetical protein